jgi:LacI family gluconate utilization system Gnt-I transcriptional repressor
MTGRRPLTLRDVSEASGVSEMTVSRVLRGKGEVSPLTRARVQEAAARLGYVPTASRGRWPPTASTSWRW